MYLKHILLVTNVFKRFSVFTDRISYTPVDIQQLKINQVTKHLQIHNSRINALIFYIFSSIVRLKLFGKLCVLIGLNNMK